MYLAPHLFASPSRLHDLGNRHNAFAKVQKTIETETNFHKITHYLIYDVTLSGIYLIYKSPPLQKQTQGITLLYY